MTMLTTVHPEKQIADRFFIQDGVQPLQRFLQRPAARNKHRRRKKHTGRFPQKSRSRPNMHAGQKHRKIQRQSRAAGQTAIGQFIQKMIQLARKIALQGKPDQKTDADRQHPCAGRGDPSAHRKRQKQPEHQHVGRSGDHHRNADALQDLLFLQNSRAPFFPFVSVCSLYYHQYTGKYRRMQLF